DAHEARRAKSFFGLGARGRSDRRFGERAHALMLKVFSSQRLIPSSIFERKGAAKRLSEASTASASFSQIRFAVAIEDLSFTSSVSGQRSISNLAGILSAKRSI